jgi:uncharacterized membrane protein YgcG
MMVNEGSLVMVFHTPTDATTPTGPSTGTSTSIVDSSSKLFDISSIDPASMLVALPASAEAREKIFNSFLPVETAYPTHTTTGSGGGGGGGGGGSGGGGGEGGGGSMVRPFLSTDVPMAREGRQGVN